MPLIWSAGATGAIRSRRRASRLGAPPAIVGAGRQRRGCPVVARLDGLEFDRAVPCDGGDLTPTEMATRAGTIEEKIWLV